MSIQPDEFLAQGPSAFLDQPSFLEQGTLPVPQPKVEDHVDFAKVALGIAAALVVLRLLMKAEFAKVEPRTQEEINEASKRIYKRIFPAWMHASVPAIAQAYRLGTTEAISYSELEQMASDYAEELGDYVNDSSILALTEGFNSQVNAGWSERLAWVRAREAYGLDSRQMKSYVKGLMARDKADYATDPIPATSRAMVDRLFLFRADRLGTNEAFRASQLGRNLVWLSLQSSGQIPEGTLKKWVTADDERVCEVCGPLDQVAIPLHRRFESGGQFFYAPGVHPNCRCELEIVYPDYGINVVKNMPGDPFNRAANGEFAASEGRKGKGMAADRGMAAEHGMAARGMAAETGMARRAAQHDYGSKEAAIKPMAQAEPMSQAAPMTAQRGAVKSFAQQEQEELKAEAAAMIRESEALQAKLEEAEAAKASKPRALSEGSVEADAATARRRLDATRHRDRQKTLGFDRTARPDDPGTQLSTLYVPASNYMVTRHLNLSDLPVGATVKLGTPDEDGESEQVIGFHEAEDIDPEIDEPWRNTPENIYDTLADSQAFADAFDHFIELPEAAGLLGANRVARPIDDEAARQISDFRRFGNGIDSRFADARRALAGMTRDELVGFVRQVVGEDPAARAFFDPDEDIVESDSATEIASMALSALEAETVENDDALDRTGFRRNNGSWASGLYSLGNRRGTTKQTEEEAVAQAELLVGDVSEKRRITPVFFQVPGWYGVVPSKRAARMRESDEGHVMGDYTVESVNTVELPRDLTNEEIDDAIDGVTIVKLKLDPKVWRD